ncbi:MAG: hypothetical protein LH606_01380 [Cytophagaceae bacterium]|nr:hypothetical protein [Cytophagaceae bacterium]
MKKFAWFPALVALGFLLPVSGRAQGVTFYPWSSVLAVSTNPQRAVWAEARFQTNSLFSSLDTELAPMVNFRRSPQSQFYAGAGANLGIVANLVDVSQLIKGYFLSVGVRVHPLVQVPQVGAAFEVSPYTAEDFKSGRFRAWLGITYQFGRKGGQ